ncbi:MAG: hypothetical protein WBG50_27525 [Desulfomonilaceae bacterium]
MDYMDQQPPICDYLHTIPVVIAGLLGFKVALVFHLLVLALVLYSTWTLIAILSSPATPYSLPARLLLGAGWVTFSLYVVIAEGFGQREHLFVLAYVPWLFCRDARYRGIGLSRALTISIGLILGPFALLKPHFFLLVVGVEAWMLFRTRRYSALWSSESVAVIAWALAFGLHFLFVPTAMLKAMFNRWIPLVLADYDSYSVSWYMLVRSLFSSPVTLIPTVAVAVATAWLLTGRADGDRRLQIESLLAAALLGVAVFIQQGKGWVYQLFPAIGLGVILLATVVVSALETSRRSNRKGMFGATFFGTTVLSILCMSAIILNLYATAVKFESHHRRRVEDDFAEFIRSYSSKTDRIAFISSSVNPAYPTLILADRLPGTRYSTISVSIPYVYKGIRGQPGKPFPYRKKGQWSLEERKFLEETGLDILKYRPRLVFVDDTPNCAACPPGFCINQYLSTIGWTANFLRDYKYLLRLHSYAVYQRTD